jgi:dipeptidyl aminopeptidase/acylaminoacyl peptidase
LKFPLGATLALSSFVLAPFLSDAQPAYTVSFGSSAPFDTDIFIADSDGGNAHALVAHAGLDSNASFSADGQWIVFTSQRSGPSKIFRVHADGSGLEQITDGDAFDDQAAFSPDAKSIAFVSTRGGQADVWILDLATHGLRNLTSSATGEFRPSWSADGQWIAFSTDRDPTAGPVLGRCAAGGDAGVRAHTKHERLRRASRRLRFAARQRPGAPCRYAAVVRREDPRSCSMTLRSKTRVARALSATARKPRKFSRSTCRRGRARR